MRSCLHRSIPIGYLSRMGYCYGRVLPLDRSYRASTRQQQQLTDRDRLQTAQRIVRAKLKNSRTILQRQQRQRPSHSLATAIQDIHHLMQKVPTADTWDGLMGYEGAGARAYFAAFGECLHHPELGFAGRSRRPPGDPVNAMLSFGYQVLWNHLLALIDLQGLDPYHACLHQGSDRHAALTSDLLEEFRAPIVDSLVMYLVNRCMVSAEEDFVYRNGGCYLDDTGRRKYLRAFVRCMEQEIDGGSGVVQPRWDLLNRQVKAFRQFVWQPSLGYRPYTIR